MITPNLFEQNVILRSLAEEAKLNASYINFALNNAAMVLLQVPIAVLLEKLAELDEENEEQSPLMYTLYLGANIVAAVLMLLVSWGRMNTSVVTNPFSSFIPAPNALILSMLADRCVMIENEELLQKYIAELTLIKQKQNTYIHVLFTLRTIMLALMLDTSSYNKILSMIATKPSGYGLMSRVPMATLNITDSMMRSFLVLNKKDPRKIKLPFADFSSAKSFEKINAVLATKINLTITDVEVLAISSLINEGNVDGALVVKATLLKNTRREIDNEKSLFMLKAILKPGSAIFNEGNKGRYTAYLNMDSDNLPNQQQMLDVLKENLTKAEIKMQKFFKCKEILMRINEKYNCASDIKHGFQCDGPLETFVFSNIIDVDLNNLLQQLRERHPNIVTMTDEGYSFSMSALDEHKADFITTLNNLYHPQNNNTLPTAAPLIETMAAQNSNESETMPQQVWKRFRSFVGPAVAPAIPVNEPQAEIAWADAAYNHPPGIIVPITQVSQLAHITGTMVYVYYSDDFVAKYARDIYIQRHIVTYRKMIAHNDASNGIKTLYSKPAHGKSGQLVAYYTSDENTDPRIVLKAVSYAFVPNKNNKHKMKKITLLEPFDVCENHAALKRLNLDHAELQQSARIIAKKQEAVLPGVKQTLA